MDATRLSALAQLNQLRLTAEEETTILELFAFLEADEKLLQEYDTCNIEAMIHCVPIENKLRADVHEKKFSREALLAGAPEQSDGYWQVPRLLE